MQRESIGHTIKVATLLCLVCSLLVSWAAVGLRPMQQANRAAEIQKNILEAAGLWEDGADVDQLFARVEPRIVDLSTGEAA